MKKKRDIPDIIVTGWLLIYGPMTLLIAIIPLFLGMRYHGSYGFLSFLAGSALALTYNFYVCPRFEYWAYHQLEEKYWLILRQSLIKAFLYQEYSPYEKYEFRTAKHQEFFNYLDKKVIDAQYEKEIEERKEKKAKAFSIYRYKTLLKSLNEAAEKDQIDLFFSYLLEHPIEMERVVEESTFVLETTDQKLIDFFLPQILDLTEAFDIEDVADQFDHIWLHLNDDYPIAGITLIMPFIQKIEAVDGEIPWKLKYYIAVNCFSYLLDLEEMDLTLLDFYCNQLFEIAMDKDEVLRKLIFETCEEFLDEK